MVAGLQDCKTVKVTPNSTSILSCVNTAGSIPKLVHVSCDSSSEAVTSNGYIREAWFMNYYGCVFTTNGSTGNNTVYNYTPVSQTPTATQTYYFSANSIEIYKGLGSITGRWNTNTEYTVEIYT